MKKIIHITDIHCKEGILEQRFQLLIEQIVSTFKNSKDYIVVLTGDIVDEASDYNYYLASKHLNKLIDAGFQVLCCPGNRDYGISSIGNKKFIPIFEDNFLVESTKSYPIKTIVHENIKDKSIAFIGLESMAKELEWTKETSLNGELGLHQLARLELLLKDADVIKADFLVIYLHHSPFSTDHQYQLRDTELLKNILMASIKPVDLMLFGHKHDGLCWHSHWGIPQIYGGGSSTLVENSPCVFRVIDPENNIPDNSIENHRFIKNYITTLKENSLICENY